MENDFTQQNIVLPSYVKEALEALEHAGYEAWCVGGGVRDALLGRPASDYDIATNAKWEQTEATLQACGFDIHRTGVKHGTVTAVRNKHALEITTYRSESTYSDGRHPDSVTFVSSIEEDLKRRDFTVNALAYHPQRGLFDCVGGLNDLQVGVLRTVGNPAQRFSEDGLRILRGCRFASQLGFTLEEETLEAMKSCKMMLGRVASERITHEMDALLMGDSVHDALMQTIDVLCAIMPELAACKDFDQHTPYHIYSVWEHTAWVVHYAPPTRLARWAALLHDIGKPGACFFEGERAHFYGHAKLSVLLGRSILQRMALAPSFIEEVLTLVRIHDVQIAATKKSVRRALNKLDGNVDLFRTLLGIKRADAQAQSELSQARLQLADELEDILDEILQEHAAFTVKQLNLNGRDVMNEGVASGPLVGELLHAALDAVIDERIPNDHDALLAFVREQLAQQD